MILGIFLFVLIIIIISLIISFFDNNRFIVRNYEVTSAKISKSFRICLLTDLHGKSYGNNNEKLIEAIDEAAPDIIISAGDLISAYSKSHQRGDERAVSLLSALAQRYPVYAANGNHEYKLKKIPDCFGNFYETYAAKQRDIGVNLLENESLGLDEYKTQITGFELQHYYYKRFFKRKMDEDYIASLVGNTQKDRYNILIAHNPMFFEEYSDWGADLVLSGHVHGGIVRLPFLGGVISPALILFPKYDGGKYTKNNCTMILSKGLGTHTIPVRVLNPGELCVIDVKKTDN